jgi:predicted nucleic acid-binding protein
MKVLVDTNVLISALLYPESTPSKAIIHAVTFRELVLSDYIINDPKDAPILDSALSECVDVIISGDKHFLSLQIDTPRILTPATYLSTFAGKD